MDIIDTASNTDDEVEEVTLDCFDCGEPLDYSQVVVGDDSRLRCGA